MKIKLITKGTQSWLANITYNIGCTSVRKQFGGAKDPLEGDRRPFKGSEGLSDGPGGPRTPQRGDRRPFKGSEGLSRGP